MRTLFIICLALLAGAVVWVTTKPVGKNDIVMLKEEVGVSFEGTLSKNEKLQGAATLKSVDGITPEAEEFFTIPEATELGIRRVFEGIKGMILEGEIQPNLYESYLRQLESLFLEEDQDYEALFGTLSESLFDLSWNSDAKSESAIEKVFDDVFQTFAYVWGQDEPRKSLAFFKEQAFSEEDLAAVMPGWLAGQIEAQNDYIALMNEVDVVVTEDVYWDALKEVAKTDTLLSLNEVLAHGMDAMTLERWRELMFSKGNSNDSALAYWFAENIGQLEQHPNFDEVEVIRMLRRFDEGDGPFMLNEDVARVEAAKEVGNYAEAAALLVELSQYYGGAIDASTAGSLPRNWSVGDFDAATQWVFENADAISDPEVLHSMVGSMYRWKGERDPENAVTAALQVEDEFLQAFATSNVIIPQVEVNGAEAPVQWVADMPQGFAKERTIAGVAIGLSRFAEDSTLEAQIKFQLLQDDFDLQLMEQQVQESSLSAEEKQHFGELVNAY